MGAYLSYPLPQLIGLPKALELVLTAATISADEAERIGLVQKTLPADALLSRAREMARAMAECRPDVLTAAKRALRHGATATLVEAMEEERALTSALSAKEVR